MVDRNARRLGGPGMLATGAWQAYSYRVALEALGLALWVVLAGFGAWLLVTGRNMLFGLPLGFDDARFRRPFGLLYILVAGFFVFRISQGSDGFGPAIALYAGMGFATWVAWRKSNDARA